MKKVIITPSKLKGSVKIPPSKSMAHRAIICASLSKGESVISNIDFSEDIIATMEGMKSLGANIKVEKDKLIINGENILKDIEGSLKGGEFKVKGNISSQFISGLLFTLPLLKEDSKIIITTELESKGYIDLTLDMIEKFGVTIKNNNYREFLIKGNQSYKPMNYKVEGDYSQAAFYFSAGALGSEINCLDLDLSSYQGDKECIEILEGMGARLIENQEESLSIIHGDLNGTIIDASQCPDIIPVLTVVAALSKGETRIINGERLRIKECDRLNAICTELNKLGADIKELKDGLIINGVKELIGGEVYSHKDHRIAMSLAIASTRCKEEVIISEPDCVKKSYPGFWEDFKSLGGILREE